MNGFERVQAKSPPLDPKSFFQIFPVPDAVYRFPNFLSGIVDGWLSFTSHHEAGICLH
jgi:hypothetical protein